jgi:DNA repair protein RadC
MLQRGCEALTDTELLAILLGSGSRNETVVEMAGRLLRSAREDLNVLGRYGVADLMRHKGVGKARAVVLMAAFELGRRRQATAAVRDEPVSSSHDVAAYFQTRMAALPYEEFWVLFLNRANRPLETFKVSQGGISATVIDCRLIMRKALELLASGIILCHNHPSGNVSPSPSDMTITRKIKEAAAFFDISVVDHVIIASGARYSFADDGVL